MQSPQLKLGASLPSALTGHAADVQEEPDGANAPASTLTVRCFFLPFSSFLALIFGLCILLDLSSSSQFSSSPWPSALTGHAQGDSRWCQCTFLSRPHGSSRTSSSSPPFCPQELQATAVTAAMPVGTSFSGSEPARACARDTGEREQQIEKQD
jgi:hypothetical protein